MQEHARESSVREPIECVRESLACVRVQESVAIGESNGHKSERL